jgi:hypothetical protein
MRNNLSNKSWVAVPTDVEMAVCWLRWPAGMGIETVAAPSSLAGQLPSGRPRGVGFKYGVEFEAQPS